jgi:replication-associated recombination protein RarA
MDLFTHTMQQRMKSEAPLAARMRPRTLEEFAGQQEIVGPGKLLRRAIEADRLFSSIILWGPPGTGKTTLAMVIANQTQMHFETLSAVLASGAGCTTSARSYLSTRCTAGTKPSKTPCCRTWRTVRSSWSGLPPKILISR